MTGPMSSVSLDDQTLLALYTKFQGERRSLGSLYRQARYDDFVERRRYEGGAMPVTLIAGEHIVAATNAVNRFNYDLHSITAWSNVFASITEDEKMQALFEFVFSIASSSLAAPYSIKQLFIRSIYEISHQTNRFHDPNWKEASPTKQTNFDDAKRVAKRFLSWPALCSALSLLNDEEFTTASDNYRNRLNHGFPPRIEVGYAIRVQREPGAPSVYTIGNAPPLLIADLIPLLGAQYDAALNCFDAYIELVKEQHTLWPAP
jgi:hypothetical protein